VLARRLIRVHELRVLLLANWCFLYLLQERHFTVLESGWLASTPPLAAAIGGRCWRWLASVLGRRYGIRKGCAPAADLAAAAGALQFLRWTRRARIWPCRPGAVLCLRRN